MASVAGPVKGLIHTGNCYRRASIYASCMSMCLACAIGFPSLASHSKANPSTGVSGACPAFANMVGSSLLGPLVVVPFHY
jgi:hypothetical protein